MQTTEPLIEQVMVLMDQGYPHEEIIGKLQAQGYADKEIEEAVAQAQTKASVESEQQIPPAPPTPQMQPSLLNRESSTQAYESPSLPPRMQEQPSQAPVYSRDTEERIQEIAESIIDEKWQRVIEDMGDMSAWKEKVKTEILSVKQEVLRIEGRVEAMQQAILGRIKEYDSQVGDVSTDVKAVEKLLQNVLGPLTENVRELKRVTERLKK